VSYQSVFRPGLFRDRVIVVTGGGSGIGRCIAHELVSLEASVAIVGRRQEKLDRVGSELGAVGNRVSAHACDIRDEDAVRTTVAAILGAHGHIDGLVNNAGGQYPSPLEKISAKGWDAVVRNNLTGGFLFARECYLGWMQAHAGQSACGIVNIVADMWNGMPGMAHSGAARAGMLNLTETASLEWAPIRVSSGTCAGDPRSCGHDSITALGYGKRGVRGSAVPAVAGCGVRIGRLPACRWRCTECQALVAACWHWNTECCVQRISPGGNPKDPA
jgi:NAD(P)-dependent dehydrogenase (short-subunit alcohol dehydrogenase family)